MAANVGPLQNPVLALELPLCCGSFRDTSDGWTHLLAVEVSLGSCEAIHGTVPDRRGRVGTFPHGARHRARGRKFPRLGARRGDEPAAATNLPARGFAALYGRRMAC